MKIQTDLSHAIFTGVLLVVFGGCVTFALVHTEVERGEVALAKCEAESDLNDLALTALHVTDAMHMEGERLQTERVYYLEKKMEHLLDSFSTCMCVEISDDLLRKRCRVFSKDSFNSLHNPNYRSLLDECEASLATHIALSMEGEEELP